MILKTHGKASLRSGRVLIEADYRPVDGGVGLLALRLEDQETYESLEGLIRLDPWIGDEYGLIEFRTGDCFLVCGAQAVVSVGASSLVLLSSVGLEYQEGEMIDSPWYVESEDNGLLVVATECRVWCLDERGAIRWLWSCSASAQDKWISGELVVRDDRVCVPLRTVKGDLSVELLLKDGLPTRP